MNIGSRQMPDRIAEFLKSQPETGMGYQIVTVKMKDGKEFERVQVLDARDIGTVDGMTDIPFNPYDIESVVVTHDKSF